MKKNELMNGDIVVTRRGELAVVICNEKDSYLLYQMCGWESLDDYDDDMIYLLANDKETPDAIMQVYRAAWAMGFSDYEDEEPIYERDYTWNRPSAEERTARTEASKKEQLKHAEDVRKMTASKNDELLDVIAQQFYGNRTRTRIKKHLVDHFLRGDISEHCLTEDVSDVVRKAIRVPGSDNIVIVYDQVQEDEYINIEFPQIYARDGAKYLARWGEELKMHVSCEIPEIGFKVHTRCIACRMDENGILQSLKDSDEEQFIHYFTTK